MSRFNIKKAKNGKYYFVMRAKNGEVILMSQGYNNREGATKGIDSVIINASKISRFERKVSSRGGEYFFVLKARNGKTIGRSEMYRSKTGREMGIKAVMKNANKSSLAEQL